MSLGVSPWVHTLFYQRGPFSDSDAVGVFGSDSLVVEDWTPGFVIGPAQPGHRGLFVVID
ncbi:hypothetical protein CULC22_02113 [Corynebacterium ulcerans BR-AD22]|nr:hypothetical protein CULC22_02113 [Corynebacterium ulcerans BR-AD22]